MARSIRVLYRGQQGQIRKNFQTPPDLVVKFQPADIVDVILWLVVPPCAMSLREIKG
jgi:hypothetical protein